MGAADCKLRTQGTERGWHQAGDNCPQSREGLKCTEGKGKERKGRGKKTLKT